MAEIKAPTGYVLTDKTFPVEIDENGVATFDGSAGLQSSANNDLADKLDSYTMNFEINIPNP